MSNRLDRRQFIEAAVATGAFTIVPRHVLGGAGHVAPSDKITLAHIGMGTQGFNELGGLLEDPQIQIVAVCDPNRNSSDYIEWGKNSVRDRIRQYLGDSTWREGDEGCPGGRDVGKYVVDTYYAKQRGGSSIAGCRAYADFRELLDTEADLDAVKIMTPDHLHATISIAALKKGKHVLMHKPIANRLHEGRLVQQTVLQTQRATHLLAYGSGTANGWIARQVQAGAIGRLREIHNWTNRPVWPQYTEIPQDQPPVPDGLDWDLWLGPARCRPYHPHYTHTVFRGWYDFGGGSMADMGIYSLWPIFTEFALKPPISAQAWATHTCTIQDNVSRVTRNDFSYPTACTLRFQFAARDDMPAWELFWYDGGMQPRLPAGLESRNLRLQSEGILFVGDEGSILASFHGAGPQVLANRQSRRLPWAEETTAGQPRVKRHQPWLVACKGGEPSPGSFLNASAITDTVNLGTVALRAGSKVEFDSQTMTITNDAHANKFFRRDYREGWEL